MQKHLQKLHGFHTNTFVLHRSIAPLNCHSPSKSTAQARSPSSISKIHHHDEVRRPCEDNRACEVPRPCEVPSPCAVHRFGGLLRKSTAPKHGKGILPFGSRYDFFVFPKSLTSWLYRFGVASKNVKIMSQVKEGSDFSVDWKKLHGFHTNTFVLHRSIAPLNCHSPSKSTAQARSPSSISKIHHHDEVRRPCEDNRACEVPRPCEVPSPCAVHRFGGLLRKSTAPKHGKGILPFGSRYDFFVFPKSLTSWLYRFGVASKNVLIGSVLFNCNIDGMISYEFVVTAFVFSGHDDVEDNYYQWDESSVADIGEEKFSEIAEHKSGDIDEGNFVETSTDQLGKEEDGVHHDGKEIQQSNMYVRRRDGPRKRFKSIAIRTPFATYSRRKRSQ
ncbi:hypothetical protein DEO72_LG3g475 [Vigna unguiculata]|uniref:Uncharacterized protein n=1 Tax=Vigna unguiculata TaxID=3917 RepID=A0A4D6LCB7_VIGUN|nr:hypothetical protein DEO72_LG3g475 [Vigna unguiculata]